MYKTTVNKHHGFHALVKRGKKGDEMCGDWRVDTMRLPLTAAVASEIFSLVQIICKVTKLS